MGNENENSLQLFDSATIGESNRDGESSDFNNRPSQNTIKSGGRRLKLNLDGIEDLDDCDVDSIKNTSARAITFHQFE